MSDVLAKNKAPAFITYIISINLLLMISTSLSLYFNTFSSFGCIAICNSTSQSITNSLNANLLFGSFILGSIEVLALRKGFGKFSFGFSFLVEILRLYTVAFQLVNFNNQLYVAISGASLISVFLSKIFAKNIKELINKPLSQNLGQIIPALVVLVIFTGSSLLSTLGLGVVSQEPNPQPFNVGNINFSMFKTPSWNAQYYLNNILDQFRAGLNAPFTPVFNVTNNSPDPARFGSNEKISSYFKEQTYYSYKYDAVTAKSGTFFPAPTGTTTEKVYLAGTQFNNQTLSQPVPDKYLITPSSPPPAQRNYNAYSLTVTTLMNHTSLYDQSLPAVWNGRTYGINGTDSTFYGSFINPNKTVVYSGNGKILANCYPLTGISSCGFTETQAALQDFPVSSVGLRLDGFSSSGTNDFMNYSMNYLEPNYQYINSHSGSISDYQSVFSPAAWTAISNAYLQLPNAADGTTPNSSVINYQAWAPLVYQEKSKYFNPNGTVMDNVNSLLNAMSPSINSQILGIQRQGGSMGLTFDADFWLTQTRASTTPGVNYPNPGQDYVNWFLSVKKGLSSEFAAALTMILRAEGIPARFVTGYALGNTSTSASSNPYVTVYQRLDKMAWTEVLVPLFTANGPTFEWVIADPVGSVLAQYLNVNQLGSQQSSSSSSRIAFIDPYSLNFSDDLSTQAGQANFGISIDRVGVDQKNLINGTYQFDNNDLNDNGILESQSFKNYSYTRGVVHVSVFVARLFYTGTAVTSFIGAGAYNVTFQVLYTSTTNVSQSAQPRYWDPNNDTKVVVQTNPATSIATATFTYYPFYPNLPGYVSLHGTAPLTFIGILSSTETVSSPTCRDSKNDITCGLGFSDTNRTNDHYNIYTDTANINYDPFQVKVATGAAVTIMSSNTNTKSLFKIDDKISTAIKTDAKLLQPDQTNLHKEIEVVQSSNFRFVSFSFFFALVIAIIIKKTDKKRILLKNLD